MNAYLQLDEWTVVEALAAHLRDDGYEVRQELKPTQRGYDIIAKRVDRPKLYIDAKGATSSRKGSARHGKVFSRTQVRDHIAKAVLAACHGIQEYPRSAHGIVVPGNHDHLAELAAAAAGIRRLRIHVWTVDAQHTVQSWSAEN